MDSSLAFPYTGRKEEDSMEEYINQQKPEIDPPSEPEPLTPPVEPLTEPSPEPSPLSPPIEPGTDPQQPEPGPEPPQREYPPETEPGRQR